MDGRERNSVNRQDRRKLKAIIKSAPIVRDSKEYYITISDKGFDKIILRVSKEDHLGELVEDYIPVKDEEAHDIQMMLNEILFKRNLIDITED